MPHLASFRKGWESENLARFLLSKISFVAHPATVSDDVGSDFFCTLFEIERKRGHAYLLPKNSFAIQIKSTDKTLDFSDKVEYLSQLETPFFVGVIDRQDLKLTIFSGEYVPFFLAYKGPPRRLEFHLCERASIGQDQYFDEVGDNHFVLRFPRVTEVRAGASDEELASVVAELSKVCSHIHNNIASRRNDEYIFPLYESDPPRCMVFAGPGSVQVFRNNFLDRLAEVFANLKWLYERRPGEFSAEEFEIYESLYYKLRDRHDTLPGHLVDLFGALKALVTTDHRPGVEPGVEGGASIQIDPGKL